MTFGRAAVPTHVTAWRGVEVQSPEGDFVRVAVDFNPFGSTHRAQSRRPARQLAATARERPSSPGCLLYTSPSPRD